MAKGPKELIEHAISHMHKESDSDRRIAFLLFDVGIETLFKTFLTLPEEVNGTSMKFSERKLAAEGGFHEVVRGVKKAASLKLKDVNLEHVQFYPNKRNTLYHDGNGITIPENDVKSYAALATSLLKILLDVDLSSYLNQPLIAAEIQRHLK